MLTDDQAVIFDIKSYAIHDGPGIRTTVFLKGCPLRCQWCANPESQNLAAEVLFDGSKCTLCQKCADVCSHEAITFISGCRHYNHNRCRGCGLCGQACDADALELCGYKVDVKTLWQKTKDDRAFWDRSGGGVTLSGGEPLLQYKFVGGFLSHCKSNYVHTAIETCGHVPELHLKAVLPYVDLFIFDLKAENAAHHEGLTGKSNERIKKNLETILVSPVDVLVRMPLIPGLNDTLAELRSVGGVLENLKPGVPLEILGYHRLGIGKYERLGKTYTLSDIKAVTSVQLAEAKAHLKEFDLTLV